jgi:ribosomal protein L40E
MSRTCVDCAAPISRQATRCRNCSVAHVNQRPDVAEARNAAIRAKFADPAHRAKMQAAARRAGETARSNPSFRAWLIENGRHLYATRLNTPASRAAVLASRPVSGAKRTETVLGWCPPEYRDEYRLLARRWGAVEARRLTLEQVAADEKRRLADLSPFERQDRALRNGARLVPVQRISPQGHATTLGGVVGEIS